MLDFLGPLLSVGSKVFDIVGSRKKEKRVEAQARLDRQMAIDQYEDAKDYQMNRIKYTVEDAKNAGIHPLYALGASSGGISPTFTLGNDSGFMHESGSGIGSALSDIATTFVSSRDRKESKRMESELHKAKLDRLRAETAAIKSGSVLDTARAASTLKRAETVANTNQSSQYDIYESPFGPVRQYKDVESVKKAEDRYGEPGEWLFGAATLGYDMLQGLGHWLTKSQTRGKKWRGMTPIQRGKARRREAR